MKSHTCKRAWVAFIAVLFTLLGLASPALALNGHPVEGEHYKIVRGPNPKSTYLKVAKGVNINTPLLAETFHTTPHDIRADNPTKTIALCHVRGVYRGKVVGESIAERVRNRASNRYWVDCPEKDQYVFIVPGELIELTGVKHLSFNEEQKALVELKACADQACVMDKAKALGAKAADSRAKSVTQVPTVEIEAVPPQPAGQQNVIALAALTHARDAALSGLDREKVWSWSFMGLFFAALIGLAALWRSRAPLRHEVDSQREEVDRLRKKNDSLSDSLKSAKGNRDKALEEQREKLEAELATTKVYAADKDRLLKARDAELVTARTSADTLRTLLNSKEMETRQWRQRLAQFLSDAHMRTRGTPLHVADGSDLVAEAQEFLAFLETHDEGLRAATLRLGQIIDGRGPDTQVRRFDLTGLHELAETATITSNVMETLCDGDKTSIVDRVDQCCSDSALSRTRAALQKREEQLATMKTEPPPCDDAEEHGKLLAESARLAVENVKLVEEKSQLEKRVNDLEDQVTNLLAPEHKSPATAPYPELPRPSQSPAIECYRAAPETSEVRMRDEEHEDVTQPKQAAAMSTLTPPDHRTSHLDMRSEKRIHAYTGLQAWNELQENHIVCAIEHDSELAILHSLAQTVTKRKFQCVDNNGQNVRFFISDLVNGKFCESLRASAPSVG